MKIGKVNAVKTKEEARQIAIDWQSWQSRRTMSYADMLRWSEYFRALGKKFGLITEFKENGII